MSFFEKLARAIAQNESLLCIGLDPSPANLPERYRLSEDVIDNLLAWNQAIITETADLVCAFKPNIAFYEALGAPGMELLRRTLKSIPDDIPVLLDAKRGDIGSTAAAYAKACFEELGVDAVTLSPYLGQDSIAPFAAYPGKGLFVLCHTSNPSAADIQHLRVESQARPLYLQVAEMAPRWSPNVGLVVGATYPDALAGVRRVAPDAWFLVPGVGAQGGDLPAALAAGLRADGQGMLIAVTRGVSLAEDHRAAADGLRRQIESARILLQNRPVAETPVDLSERRALIEELFDLGAVKFGNFTLASGMQSPIYIDLRLLVSRPQLLAQAAKAYGRVLEEVPCDRIAGVPYAALPIGTAVALATNIPMIYPRKEAKAYGLGKDIEGAWNPGERVAIIEDLFTSGGSTVKTAERLRAAGLVVEDAIVLIDREQGARDNLAAAGVRAHSVFTLSEILETLVTSGRLTPEKQQEVLTFIRQSRPQ